MDFRDKSVLLFENDIIIVPKGVEHRPVAEEEASIMLFEPATTLNTGMENNSFTRPILQKI
jgi:mannose-6-phosphate isomerase-like protein (cupin superfamily)